MPKPYSFIVFGILLSFLGLVYALFTTVHASVEPEKDQKVGG
jgi:hypothetical protein